MARISLYTDIDNIATILSLDHSSDDYYGMKLLISKECKITFCENEAAALQNELFPHIANEITSGGYEYNFRSEEENFLNPPFKTNLQEHFQDKSTIFFSYDSERINLAKTKSGILMAGLNDEISVYKKLNFHKDIFRCNRILTIGDSFKSYNDIQNYIMPFTEIIINEPYLFLPEQKNWDIKEYLEKNFKELMKTLFLKVQNKVNIIIGTFVREKKEIEFPFYENGFEPLYKMCSDFFDEILGVNKYKLWITVSPMARKGRHDRYIITNYQYLESGSGLTFFDDRGNFSSRGEAIHLYSIAHDDAREHLIPSAIKNFQTLVIDSILNTHKNRIMGAEKNGNSYFLKFNKD